MSRMKVVREWETPVKSDWSDVEVAPSMGRGIKIPTITIYSSAPGKTIVFAINKALTNALDKELGTSYQYVIPFYSRKNNAIIFDFTDEYQSSATKLSKTTKYNRTFTMTPFFEHFNLPTPPHCICLRLRQEKIPDMGTACVMYLNEAK